MLRSSPSNQTIMCWNPDRSICFALLVVLFASISAHAQTLSPATVVSTGDGDTLRVQRGNDRVTVRLACVDSPERKQPTGQEASARLKQLLPVGTPVQLRVVDRDRYQRLVAEVFKNGQSVNLQMVRDGAAVIYPEYFSSCQSSQKQYVQAQRSRKAFWSQSSPVMPWDWRRQNR
jgi:micrococcal nuclease